VTRREIFADLALAKLDCGLYAIYAECLRSFLVLIEPGEICEEEEEKEENEN
jgi:hypothetical protein